MDIQKNKNLAEFSTFKLGGSAQEFIAAQTEKDFMEAMTYAQKKKLPVFVLGGGSNIVFSDQGFTGLVIKNDLKEIKKEGEKIKASSGIILGNLISFCLDNNLTGLENLSGIPGTLGGAIWGNAGAFGTQIGDFIEKVSFFNTQKGKISEFSQKKCQFEYRTSFFKKNPENVIISAVLNLKKGEQKKIALKIKEVLETRKAHQPKDWYGTVGSFFKNPKVENLELIERFEKEKNKKLENETLPAGWLIEKAGFLGKQIGGIKVSENHGNFIVNTGKGKTEDLIILVSLIKQKVRNKFHVQLQEEAQYVGFNNFN